MSKDSWCKDGGPQELYEGAQMCLNSTDGRVNDAELSEAPVSSVLF